MRSFSRALSYACTRVASRDYVSTNTGRMQMVRDASAELYHYSSGGPGRGRAFLFFFLNKEIN